MSEVRTPTTTDEIQGRRAKNSEWKAKAAAPADWVSTLMRGKREGSSVLLDFKNGPRGAPMLAEAFRFDTLIDGHNAYIAVAPMAAEIWDAALLHRSELSGDRYYYRIRVINEDEDGDAYAIHESAWIELAEGEFGDVMPADTIGDADSLHIGMLRMQQAMILKLFGANIQLTRASGILLRQATEGVTAGIESQFGAVKKVQEMAQESINLRMEMAQAEGDAEEVRELGVTARKWMQLSHERTLADKGVEPPDLPASRVEAALGLYQSINMGQMAKLRELLGPERSELLLGVLNGAQKMSDEQLGQVIAAQFGSQEQQLELWGIAEQVFSTDFVPSTYAVWQTRAAHILINGRDEDA